MKQFKHATLTLALAGLLSAQAQASEPQNLQVIQPLAAFSEVDISTMFVQTDTPMRLAVLSPQEMKETEGAWGPVGAVIGGVGGAAGYFLNNQIGGGRFSPAHFAAAVGAGAALGAVAGPAGVVWGFNRNLAAGMAWGVVDRYGW